jgi:hypothetical protein
MDYYAIDGWVFYPQKNSGPGPSETSKGWLISSRDAAVVSFGRPNVSLRISRFPENAGKALFMLFNNTWDTNFAADSHGIFEYRFDISHCRSIDEAAALSLSLASEPVVAVNLMARP